MTAVDGILNLNKPVGPTSFEMVRLVRRAAGERRVGHAGTLDPAASGVLPLLLGSAARLSEYFLLASKEYEGAVRFGVTTNTYDAAGSVTSRQRVPHISAQELQAILADFRGAVLQQPPMYSALKREGKPLYELARANIEVERAARTVQIYSLALVSWDGSLLRIAVECGRGTYIRSLAHDLGRRLGCGAHLEALQRTRVGPFSSADAVSPEEVSAAAQAGTLAELLHAPETIILPLPAMLLTAAECRATAQGKALPNEQAGVADGQLSRAYAEDGLFQALLRFEAASNLWRPDKVFVATPPVLTTPQPSMHTAGDDAQPA